MSDKIKEHILGKFMYEHKLTYNELWDKTISTSSHFDYYLKKMIESNLVEKKGKYYSLTTEGLKLITGLDGESMQNTQKPIVCAFALALREDGKILMQLRKKQPFKDQYSVPGGKVEFGEFVEQTAKKEFKAETGLTAKKIELKVVNDKLTYDKDSADINHHIIGFFYLVTEFEGELIEEHREGINEWISFEELKNKDKILELEIFLKKVIEDTPVKLSKVKRSMKDQKIVDYQIIE